MCPKPQWPHRHEVPKPSDELDLMTNPCGVDGEALGSKFGGPAYCPDLVGGLPPSLRANSGVILGNISDCLRPRPFTFPKVTV